MEEVRAFYVQKFPELERLVLSQSQDHLKVICTLKFVKRQQVHMRINQEIIGGKPLQAESSKFADKHRNGQFDRLWEKAVQDSVHPRTRVMIWSSPEYHGKSDLQKLVELEDENTALLKIWNNDQKKALGSGMLTNKKNLKLIKEVLHASNLPDFEWNFPTYLRSPDTCYLKQDCLDFIYRWFLEECLPEHKERRKALILFSEKREYGKSTFARSLVSGIEDYYIEIGGVSMAEKNFVCKTKAKLFIIDDMEINLRTHLEMWKKLLSSQRVNLRDCYFNQEFPGGIPVIVTTNNLQKYNELAGSSLFEDQCYFLPLPDFMGPLGQKPNTLLNDRATNRKKYHFGAVHSPFDNGAAEEDQPNDENSGESERFKAVVKREEWSECYKKCQEDDRIKLLTKLAEVQAEVTRLQTLHAPIIAQQQQEILNNMFMTNMLATVSPQPQQINVYNIGYPMVTSAVCNSQTEIQQHNNNKKSHDYMIMEFEKSPSISSPLTDQDGRILKQNKSSHQHHHSSLETLTTTKKKVFLTPTTTAQAQSTSAQSLPVRKEPSLSGLLTSNNMIEQQIKGEKDIVHPQQEVSKVPLAQLTADSVRDLSIFIKTERCPWNKLCKLIGFVERKKKDEENKLEILLKKNNEERTTISAAAQIIKEIQEKRTKDAQVQYYSLKAYYYSFQPPPTTTTPSSSDLMVVSTEVFYLPSHHLRRNAKEAVGRGYAHTIGFTYGNVKYGALQTFKRDYRAYLCNEEYWDVDLVNAHPSILSWILESRGQTVPTILGNYVRHRDTVLKEIQTIFETDRDNAKQLMLRYMYGGNYKYWMIEHDIEEPLQSEESIALLRKLEEYAKELMQMGTLLAERYFPRLKQAYDASHQDVQKEGSLLSFILQEKEKEVLIFSDAHLAGKGRPFEVLIHDGGLIRRTGRNESIQDLEVLLQGLNDALKGHFGTELLSFIHKPLQNNLAFILAP